MNADNNNSTTPTTTTSDEQLVVAVESPLPHHPAIPFIESLPIDLSQRRNPNAEELKCDPGSASEDKEMIATLQREKKELEYQFTLLQGKHMQLEEMYYEMKHFYQEQWKRDYAREVIGTIPTLVSKKKKEKVKDQSVECAKCHKHLNSQYLKHHQRTCGTSVAKYVLNPEDYLAKMQQLNVVPSQPAADQLVEESKIVD